MVIIHGNRSRVMNSGPSSVLYIGVEVVSSVLFDSMRGSKEESENDRRLFKHYFKVYNCDGMLVK